MNEGQMIASDEAANGEGRVPWTILSVALALCLAAVAFRYGVVEYRQVALLCEAQAPAWWCSVRQGVIEAFYPGGFGVASLIAGSVAIALFRRPLGRPFAIVAVLVGAPALVLYSADFAVPGFFLGLIRLIRR